MWFWWKFYRLGVNWLENQHFGITRTFISASTLVVFFKKNPKPGGTCPGNRSLCSFSSWPKRWNGVSYICSGHKQRRDQALGQPFCRPRWAIRKAPTSWRSAAEKKPGRGSVGASTALWGITPNLVMHTVTRYFPPGVGFLADSGTELLFLCCCCCCCCFTVPPLGTLSGKASVCSAKVRGRSSSLSTKCSISSKLSAGLAGAARPRPQARRRSSGPSGLRRGRHPDPNRAGRGAARPGPARGGARGGPRRGETAPSQRARGGGGGRHGGSRLALGAARRPPPRRRREGSNGAAAPAGLRSRRSLCRLRGEWSGSSPPCGRSAPGREGSGAAAPAPAEDRSVRSSVCLCAWGGGEGGRQEGRRGLDALGVLAGCVLAQPVQPLLCGVGTRSLQGVSGAGWPVAAGGRVGGRSRGGWASARCLGGAEPVLWK